MTFDQAQSPRLGQRTQVESTYVRMFSGVEIPEAAWPGQIIYRTDLQILQVYTEAGAWEDVVSGVPGILTFVGPSIPVSVSAGDMWFDTDDHYKLYLATSAGADAITSGEWVLVQDSYSAQQTANVKTQTFVQNSPPPTSVTVGDLWYNTSDFFKPYRAHSVGATTIATGQWQSVQDGYIGLADLKINTKARTFIQTSPPTAVAAGDLWFDSDDGNKAYRAFAAGVTTIGSSGWVAVQDGTIATAQATANSKNTVFYAGTAPTGGTYKINDLWFDTANDMRVSTWDGSAWVLIQFGTTAITPGGITTPNIQVGAIVSEHIDVGAITADKLTTVLTLTTAIEVGTNITMDDAGIVIENSDPTKQATVFSSTGDVFVQGAATLDSVQINNDLTVLGSNNVVNGGVKLGTGFAEPTKKLTVSQYFKNISHTSSTGFDRWGFWEKDGSNWVGTDSLIDCSVQQWAKNGGFASPIFTATNFVCKGGVVFDGSNYYLLGQDSNDSQNWRIRKYTTGGSLVTSWRTSAFSPAFDMALGWNFTNNTLLVCRVGTAGAMTVERWNTNGTSAGSDLAFGTWAVVPAGICFTSGTTLFAADRYVITSKSNGTRIYNTSLARVSSEEFPVFSNNMRGAYYDGSRMWGWDGRYSSQHSIEPGGSKDFALAWVDNDPAGSGTAVSLLGPRSTVALTRFKWIGVSSPAPPDDGTTDGANTVAVYHGTVAGTMYQQTVMTTSPSVGGTPLFLTAEYDKALVSTATPHSGTSGFAGRPSTAPGTLFSESLVPSSSNPQTYFAGNGQYRLAGTNLDDVAWTALSGSAVSGFGVQYKVKNGMVIVQVDGGIAMPGNTTGVDLASGTIPTALRPPSVSVRGGAYFTGRAGIIGVSTGGVVTAWQATGVATSSCGGTVSWPVP